MRDLLSTSVSSDSIRAINNEDNRRSSFERSMAWLGAAGASSSFALNRLLAVSSAVRVSTAVSLHAIMHCFPCGYADCVDMTYSYCQGARQHARTVHCRHAGLAHSSGCFTHRFVTIVHRYRYGIKMKADFIYSTSSSSYNSVAAAPKPDMARLHPNTHHGSVLLQLQVSTRRAEHDTEAEKQS